MSRANGGVTSATSPSGAGRPVRSAPAGAPARPLILTLLLSGCALPQGGAPGAGLQAEAHQGLREVLVIARSEGALAAGGAREGWDGMLPATLHRELGAAEARRLGIEQVALAAPAAAPAPVSAPAPLTAGSPAPDAQWASDAEATAPDAQPAALRPPPGSAWLDLYLADADFFRAALGDSGEALLLRFRATLRAAPASDFAAAFGAAPRGELEFTLVDPEVRPAQAWATGDGAAARAAAARLLQRAARRIAAGLLATVDEGSLVLGDERCGLRPLHPVAPAAGGTVQAPPPGSVIRWSPWTPGLAGRAGAAVTYEVRVWRVAGVGWADEVLAADGITQTSLTVAPPSGPPATYAWTVRGVATLPGGRRVFTPWSQRLPTGGACAPGPSPGLAWRLEHRGGGRGALAPDADDLLPGPPATSPPERATGPAADQGRLVTTSYQAVTWTTHRSGLEPGLNAANGAGTGLLYGAGRGLLLSLACGPLAPACMMVTVPAGAAIGTVAGATVGGISSAVEGSEALHTAPLAPEPLATALREAAARAAHEPRLVAEAEGAAQAALAEAAPAGAGSLRLDAIHAKLESERGEAYPIRPSLVVTGTLTRPGAAAVTRRVEVSAGRLPAQVWAEEGAVLPAVFAAQARQAGRELVEALLAPEPEPAAPPPTPAHGTNGSGLSSL